jgi:hypothetical protein
MQYLLGSSTITEYGIGGIVGIGALHSPAMVFLGLPFWVSCHFAQRQVPQHFLGFALISFLG